MEVEGKAWRIHTSLVVVHGAANHHKAAACSLYLCAGRRTHRVYPPELATSCSASVRAVGWQAGMYATPLLLRPTRINVAYGRTTSTRSARLRSD